MTLRKLFTTIMCFAFIITPNFMATASSGEDVAAGPVTYLACLAVCAAVAWWTGKDDKYCIAVCAATLATPNLPAAPETGVLGE